MSLKLMELKVLLPVRVFLEVENIQRLVVETPQGFVGLLPQRRDCVLSLVPSIFTWESQQAGKNYLAVDEGILVKTANRVLVSVRHALGNMALQDLKEALENELVANHDKENDLRALLTKLENGFVRQFFEFQHG